MILGVLYFVVRSLLDLLVLSRKADAALQVEVLHSAISSASSNARSAGLACNPRTAWFSAP
jgi:hypothetical protein